jgi:uncharacterized cofD-like protein
MSGVLGNFEEAIKQTSRVLAVRGQIVPSTLVDVTLEAKTENEETIQGEANISGSCSRIKEVRLQPPNPLACPEAIRAILEADVIVVGPGSLLTSVLPNLLVDGIRRAIKASSALKVYVCNVATQPGETDGFSVVDHVRVLESHVGKGLFRHVLANSNIENGLPETQRSEPVRIDGGDSLKAHLILADVVSEENRYHHDSKKLGEALIRLYYDRNHLNQTLVAEEEAAEAKVASAIE